MKIKLSMKRNESVKCLPHVLFHQNLLRNQIMNKYKKQQHRNKYVLNVSFTETHYIVKVSNLEFTKNCSLIKKENNYNSKTFHFTNSE